MVQRSDGARLAFESLAELTSGDFDRDLALHTRVSGSVHFSHAALAHKGKNFIGAEFVAHREWHVLDLAKCSRTTTG
jgi:hypothetical protein